MSNHPSEASVSTAQDAETEQRLGDTQLSENRAGDTQAADQVDNLDLIMDVLVTVSVEVGDTRIPIRRLMQMRKGSTLELDQLAGQPMNVLVNGTPIAQGEVVMVKDRVGIRLTDVISPRERMRKLG